MDTNKKRPPSAVQRAQRQRPPRGGDPRSLHPNARDFRRPPAHPETADPATKTSAKPDDPQSDQADETLVCGKNAVAELLQSGAPIDTVYLSDSLPQPVAAYYTALGRQAGAVVKPVHAAKLRGMTGMENHQGVACRAAAIPFVEPQDMLRAAADAGCDPLLVLADGVEDPHNLGAILRTALLCGAQGAIIPRRGGSGITPTVMRASAGAAALLPVARVANIGQTVRWLKEQNVFVYCAQMGGQPPAAQNLTGPLALVLGNEGNGVSPLVQKLCDGVLSLPMAAGRGGVDSFNVSVAAGMLLYEIGRQRAALSEAPSDAPAPK